MTVTDVYREVADALLEPLPAGLSLGVYTEAQFLTDFADVVDMYLQETGLIKALINLPITAGTSQYTEPDYVLQVQDVTAAERYLHQETAQAMDHLVHNWKAQTDTPQRWHEDRLPPQTLEIMPKPRNTGYTVSVSAPLYGTIGNFTVAADGDFTLATTPLYGTISSISGQVFWDTADWLLGTIQGMVSATGNLTMVSTVKPIQNSFVLGDFIRCVPASFVCYLKYGVLAMVFGRNAETRDTLRARYCEARYKEGVNLARAVTQDALEEER